ncbi:hypothetical protein [Brevibacillus fortis]|uniref:hypothetical protein n=1 Tax=Brevibacillus fortis TaxID=2126352 RepID=UPI0038FCFFC2
MARLKLKIGNNELEIESSVEEINKQLDRLESLYLMLLNGDLNEINKDSTKEEFPSGGDIEPLNKSKPDKLTIDDVLEVDFSQWIKKLKIKTDDVVLFLIAAFYTQKRKQDCVFTEHEVITLLEQNGVEFKNLRKIMQKNEKTGWMAEVLRERGISKYQLSESTEKSAVELITNLFNW